jgi:hypothetical protein
MVQLVLATGAHGLGALQYPSIEESVAGVRGILSRSDPFSPLEGAPASAFVEFCENQLYGIAGLRTPGVRAGCRAGRVALTGAVARLSTDVGHETFMSLTPACYDDDRWAASVGVTYESAYVQGFPPARVLSVTVRSRVDITGSVSVGGEIDRYRLSGGLASDAGADATVMVALRPVSGATLYAVAGMDRWTGVLPSVSMVLDGAKALRLSFGYEGVTRALKGALALRLGGLLCAAGVDYHPVLGARRGVSLLWRR